MMIHTTNKKEVLRFDCVNKVKVEKKKLIRVVLTPEQTLVVDLTGKLNGRGAYLSADKKTIELAKVNKALDKSLGVAITPEVYQRLEEIIDAKSKIN